MEVTINIKDNITEMTDPILLTLGPLTTSMAVKQVMLHDWGSRDRQFIAINQQLHCRIIEIAATGDSHICVAMQGSGTFSVEAMLTTFMPQNGKILILINGAYGVRATRICQIAGHDFCIYETAEDILPDMDIVKKILDDDVKITHVFAVHCETTSGILNPIKAIADIVKSCGRRLLIDSMSAFGALEINGNEVYYDALAASSNKCLQSIPGMGFVICRKAALAECEGNATCLSLDLFDQNKAMSANGQWRFTRQFMLLYH